MSDQILLSLPDDRPLVSAAREPIAIIGIGCRFPGGADSPEKFWRLLCDGVDAITPIPVDRWHVPAFYDPDPAKPGKTYVRWGGFIDDIDLFDASFFGISPREAASVDPQHRILLEVTYEAFEDAGLAPRRLAGSNAGVFIGISTCDYGAIQTSVLQRQAVNAYTNIGLGMCIAANRISYFFDFHGPSLAVDTACSSSLVAFHLACQGIWSGECSLAVTGGVNAILRPEATIGFSKSAMLAPDGRCKSFDARADGYVRSEGAGVVLLKPLAKAVADGDPIYAVVRMTITNQDGRTSGISLPNGLAQEAMLRDAYRQAGISPEHVRYIEAHGTGTAAGDPIEVKALGSVLGRNRPPGNQCLIGSVKSNIGHLEAASGMAGLIKTVLAIKHGQIPPNLHFETPNPNIPFAELQFRVPQGLEPWPDAGTGHRIAGVNSFGFGGANAHVILDRAPTQMPAPPPPPPRDDRALLFPLSARSPEALQSAARALVDFSRAGEGDISLSDICYTASVRREHHHHRLALVPRSHKDLREHLEAFLAGEARPGMSHGRQASDRPTIAFVFSGMGPQWWGMGRELLRDEQVFRHVIEQCDELLRRHADWSLLEELTRGEQHSRIHDTHIAQPAIFSLQVGLAALWRSWGVEPHAVVGHSVGEVAAAHVAGILTLPDAIQLIFHRSRLQQQTAGQGGMLAVGLSAADAQGLLKGYEEHVSIGAINSPSDVTLSGPVDLLRDIAHSLERDQVFHTFLHVEVPYHSPRMGPLRAELLTSLQGLQPHPASIPFASTAIGNTVHGSELDAAYWWKNIRHPVQFAAAMDHLVASGHNLFIELSPHPVLATFIAKCLAHANAEGTVLPSLRRQEPERAILLGSLGRLFTVGYPVAWDRFYPGGGRLVRLPAYPWQRERFWNEPEQAQRRRLGSTLHPLLGNPVDTAHPTWEVELNRSVLTYLDDHRVQDVVVYPGAAYVEMALAAGRESFGQTPCVVEELMLQRALVLSGGELPTLQVIREANHTSFGIYGRASGADQRWARHATGKLRRLHEGQPIEQMELQDIRARCPRELPKRALYEQFRGLGLRYGPYFQGIERLWAGHNEALGEIRIHPDLEGDVHAYQLHPTVLDAGFQVLLGAMALNDQGSDGGGGVYLPVQIDRIKFYDRPRGQLYVHARLTEQAPTHITGSLRLFEGTGEVVADVQGLLCRETGRLAGQVDTFLYEDQWKLQGRSGRRTSSRPAAYILSPQRIVESLHPTVERLFDALDRRTFYASIEPQVDALVRSYILEAFRHLGWEDGSERPFSLEALAEQLGVIPDYHRLLGRLLQILADGGDAEAPEGRWLFRPRLDVPSPHLLWRRLWAQYPAYQAEMRLLQRCGDGLAEVLTGALDPLQLIFPQGSLATAEHLYQDAPAYRIYNLLTQEAVAAALARIPHGHTVRILEIGGGSGGMSSFVLRRLPPDRTEYVFSDISNLFITHAQQKFPDYQFLEFELLDIEKDPVSQGFPAHSFDLILASDALHATRDLRRTLEHVKQLLSSEGLLVLLEVTQASPWLTLVFGLLKGWWLFGDDELRKTEPWISRPAWHALLREVGFTEVASLTDTPASDDGLHSVILARGPAVPSDTVAVDVTPSPPAESRPWLIFMDSHGVGDYLAQRLHTCNDIPILVSPGASFQRLDANHFQMRPGRREDMRRLLEQALAGQPALRGIVHGWSLDALPPDDMTLASLEATQLSAHLSVLHLVQELAEHNGEVSGALWLVTSGPQAGDSGLPEISLVHAPLWGLARVINNEYSNLRCKVVDLSLVRSGVEEVDALFEELWSAGLEDEIALRGEARYVHRLARTSLKRIHRQAHSLRPGRGQQPFCVEMPTPGILTNLTHRAITRRAPQAHEVEIEVRAASLNFKDVMVAMGLLPDDALEGGFTGKTMGMECAGNIVAIGEGVTHLAVGDAVVTCAPSALRTHLVVDTRFMMKKPDHLTYEEAATIPIAFLTAHYSLHHLGHIHADDRLLIHAATGGVGLAALQLAQRAGATVFATAGTPEKRELLGALGVPYVMDSRSLAFADEIMDRTGGQGVTMVLNSLAGEAMAKSFSVLSPSGRFIEIGKRDIYENNTLELRPFRKNLSLFAVDLDRLCVERPDLIRSLFQDVMQGFQDGSLHPLPHRVFPVSEIVNAFRYMAQARHIGKVVISMYDAELDIAPPPPKPVAFSGDGTYLVTGGLGGFGLAVAQWLVERGARHLVLLGRRGAASPEAREIVADLKQAGVDVVVATADVTNEPELTRVLDDIRHSAPPLRGVIHAAMVLDDCLLPQLNEQRLRRVMAPKALGAWNLHTHTLHDPLDHFVLFSSFTSLIGNPGQGNYVAANAFLDALAHHRRAQGRPALTVNWGAVSDVGYVAQSPPTAEKLDYVGVKAMPAHQLLDIMGLLLQHGGGQIGVGLMNWQQLAKSSTIHRSSRFAYLTEALTSEGGDGGGVFLLDALMAVAPDERMRFLVSHICEHLAKVLGTSPSRLDVDQSLLDLGFDSLMAVQIGNQIQGQFGVNVPPTKFMDGLSISGLASFVIDQLTKEGTVPIVVPSSEAGDGERLTSHLSQEEEVLVEHVETLSEAEVDTLLRELLAEEGRDRREGEGG